MQSHRPNRRTFLQAAAAGLTAAPLLGATGALAAEASSTTTAESAEAAANDLPIIDAHIHLWDLSRYPVPWIVGDPVLEKSYVLQDFKQHSAGTGVVGMVYVQASWALDYSLLEADYVANLAAHDRFVQGMVAYAPLEFGEQVRSYLDTLVTRGLVIKGIRRALPDVTDTTFNFDRYIRGIQILPEYGLSFDILGNYHAQGPGHLDMAIKIAQQAPNTQLIIDHLLKPNIQDHSREPWATKFAQLAQFPNVWTKISGMVTEADVKHWTAADLKPYIDHALSVFGEDRVVFGGDWPPVLGASTYANWVQTAQSLTTGMGAAGQRKLFAENARRFYRLPTV
ncbi:MAG: amidohydrolase family protein [Chloroflexi bacterium]|nr:amidohydrolase family protein [Chloroflexota bacterium]